MPKRPHQQGQRCPVRWSGRQAVVALPGQVDLSNAGMIAGQLMDVISRGAIVLIADMTATRSCDYSGTGALARAYRCAEANGTELRLVIPAPAVRRVIALSGLDRLLTVASTLEAAQAAQVPPAVVLPLPPRAASSGSAAPAHPDGPRPVTRLPVAGSASLDGSGHAVQQAMRRHDFEETLTRVTTGIFRAGLVLQAALEQPADGLRQTAEHALDLLESTVREARDAAFAEHRRAADALAHAAEPGVAVVQPESSTQSGSPKTVTSDLVHLARLQASEAARIRAQSREVRARTREVAALSAASQDRVAASLNELADGRWRCPASLHALSQTAANRAVRMRQWARGDAAIGLTPAITHLGL